MGYANFEPPTILKVIFWFMISMVPLGLFKFCEMIARVYSHIEWK